MKNKICRSLGIITIIIAVTFALGFVKVASLPKTINISNQQKQSITLENKVLKSNIYTLEAFNKKPSKNTYGENKDLSVKLFGLIPMKNVTVNVSPETRLIPGGKPVGIKLTTDGIIVVGFSDIEVNNTRKESPGALAGMEIGDVLLEANNEKLNDINTLSNIITKSGDKNISFKVKRKEEVINLEIKPVRSNDGSKSKIGLWVRNSTSGVGTLTFYHEGSGEYGALGHPINDIDTGKTLTVKEGYLYNAKILSVEKGEKGKPGELRGMFTEKDKIGTLSKNTISGVYGKSQNMNINSLQKNPLLVGIQSEVKEGPAKILTCVNGDTVKEYDILIEKANKQTSPSPKSMVIEVVDKELLEKTGGIVQGMSGSPILQNGKIIGAVTHVFVNKPNKGYGIYIEWMLKETNIKK